MRGALGSNATIWFDFNNLGLALRIGLKLAIWPFETSVWKRLKWKVGQFWELSFTFVQVIRKKLVRDLLPPLSSWIGLNIYIYICLWHDKLFILWYEQKNYAGVMLQINMVQLASNTIKSTATTTSKCYLILNVHTIIKA